MADVIAASFDRFSFEVHLEFVENTLVEREQLISQGVQDSSFDWAADLAIARKKQADNLRWIHTHQATRLGYIDFWRTINGRIEEYSEKLAISGMNLIIGFHGAVALGAIKILTEKESDTAYAEKAATVVLVCAMAGIALFASGKIIAYHAAAQMAGQIRGKLLNSNNSDFVELSEFVQKKYTPNILTIWLIYGSLFWFIVYSSAVLFILLQG